MPEKEIGKVIHYYDKAMVAVVELNDALALGDKIKFVHHGSEFEQIVESMEVEHGKIQSAKAGEEVAVKTWQKTHENAKVYRMD